MMEKIFIDTTKYSLSKDSWHSGLMIAARECSSCGQMHRLMSGVRSGAMVGELVCENEVS